MGWVCSGGSNLAPGPLGSVAGDPDRHRGWLLCPSPVPAAAGRAGGRCPPSPPLRPAHLRAAQPPPAPDLGPCAQDCLFPTPSSVLGKTRPSRLIRVVGGGKLASSSAARGEFAQHGARVRHGKARSQPARPVLRLFFPVLFEWLSSIRRHRIWSASQIMRQCCCYIVAWGIFDFTYLSARQSGARVTLPLEQQIIQVHHPVW
jgi:hypothetical protein